MFALFNQARSDQLIGIDVNNIKEFTPEEIEAAEGEPLQCTLIHLYDGEPWAVRQSMLEVFVLCEKAKKGN